MSAMKQTPTQMMSPTPGAPVPSPVPMSAPVPRPMPAPQMPMPMQQMPAPQKAAKKPFHRFPFKPFVIVKKRQVL